jgi:hypothetical protein
MLISLQSPRSIVIDGQNPLKDSGTHCDDAKGLRISQYENGEEEEMEGEEYGGEEYGGEA